MEFLKNIENKIKLVKFILVLTLIFAFAVIVSSLVIANNMISKSQNKIWVLDNNNALLANISNVEDNREAERMSHVKRFHELFFSMSPDEKQIEKNITEALYLIDETGTHQYMNLKEKGYYTQVLSSNAIIYLTTDSIVMSTPTEFTFYGKQIIERKTSRLRRSLVTSGRLEDTSIRTLNNPSGIIIRSWKTLENKDLSFEEKSAL